MPLVQRMLHAVPPEPSHTQVTAAIRYGHVILITAAILGVPYIYLGLTS